MKKSYPLLITNRLEDCAIFYTKHFNFEIVYQQDWYVHLIHKASGSELAFMTTDAGSQPAELHAGFNGAGLVYSFEVEDAKSEYERLTKEDIQLVLKLKDEPWGQRHFILRDPAGTFIDVVQQLDM